MGEEIKEKLYDFLKDHAPKRFNLTNLTKQSGISWTTVGKWISVLLAEEDRNPRVNVEDHGNVKIVWIEIEPIPQIEIQPIPQK